MARIRSLTPRRTEGRPGYTTTDATWSRVRSPEGELLIQVTTYGSDSRASEPKSSQVIDIDASIAANLVDLLIREFDLRFSPLASHADATSHPRTSGSAG